MLEFHTEQAQDLEPCQNAISNAWQCLASATKKLTAEFRKEGLHHSSRDVKDSCQASIDIRFDIIAAQEALLTQGSVCLASTVEPALLDVQHEPLSIIFGTSAQLLSAHPPLRRHSPYVIGHEHRQAKADALRAVSLSPT